MSRYLNSLNIGIIMCENYQEKDGHIIDIYNIKNKIKMNDKNRVTFKIICDFNFVEFEVPEKEKVIAFRIFIRTLGGGEPYVIPFMICEMGISDDINGVMTQQMPAMLTIDNFEFPRKGRFAIEIYKNFGKIDTKLEETNIDYYRNKENFINAISFEVV